MVFQPGLWKSLKFVIQLYTHPTDFNLLKLFEYYSDICIVLHVCAWNAQKVYRMRITIGKKLGN